MWSPYTLGSLSIPLIEFQLFLVSFPKIVRQSKNMNDHIQIQCTYTFVHTLIAYKTLINMITYYGLLKLKYKRLYFDCYKQFVGAA